MYIYIYIYTYIHAYILRHIVARDLQVAAERVEAYNKKTAAWSNVIYIYIFIYIYQS